MTKEQCLSKVKEMADQVPEHLMEKAEQLLRSGAVNLEAYEDDYRLPKALLTACLEYEAWSWQPLPHDKDLKRLVANLRHF